MRIALVIITIFLGTIVIELEILSSFWSSVLAGIAWFCLWNDYIKSKKGE